MNTQSLGVVLESGGVSPLIVLSVTVQYTSYIIIIIIIYYEAVT